MISKAKLGSGRAHLLGVASLVLVLSLCLPSPVQAQAEEQPGNAGEVTSANSDSTQATLDDGGNWELGIHGTAHDLPAATAAERAGMAFWLAPASNWDLKYSFNEATAWEKDFKRAALGGWENNYADAVDLQFYVGHGWPGGFTFANANHSDGSLVSNDCFRSWGDNDNEWLALTSCQVMANSNLSNWAACMNGQHLIMGFVTNASAYNNMFSTQAYHFGRYIRLNYTMPQAWYKACDVAQRGRVTRTIINELACLNDRPNVGSVCADSHDTDWWYQTHSCGTETAIHVPMEQLQAELPVFRVEALSTDEAAAEFSSLGNVFGIPVTTTLQAAALQQADNPFLVSVSTDGISRTLEMDKNSGLFTYGNLSQLWTNEQAEQALAVSAASPNYIDNDAARQIADNFLRQNDLNSTGAVFYEVVSDTISSQIDAGAVPTNSLSVASVEQADETPILWQVIYSRRLSANMVTAAGGTQPTEFSVVGPGAKQKVYVPVSADVGAANVLQTTPIGVQGGWRGIEPLLHAASGQQVMVAILPAETVRSLYLALPDSVALNDIPLDVESREILSDTVAYWEEAIGVSQGELIPVYELKVRLKDRQSGEFVEDFAYVPASPLYMRPIASILDAPAVVVGGSELELNAADATQTLSALGLGDFDFALGNGDYTYEWILGSLTDGVTIGTGRTLTYEVPTNAGGREGQMVIHLRVTDINSPNQSFATTSATIAVPAVFLPIVEQ